MPNRTLLQIVQKIEGGYAAGLTMFDAGMVDAVQELADRTGEIGELIAAAAQAKPVVRAPSDGLASSATARGVVGTAPSIEMGFRAHMMECLVNAARQHGEDSGEPDHENGDLLDLLRPMRSMLTESQLGSCLAAAFGRELAEGGFHEEVERLRQLVPSMWAAMSPAQQRDYLATDSVESTISGQGAWSPASDDLALITVSTVNELDGTEWANACKMFGLDTSFAYPDDSVVEIVNAYRFDHLRDPESAQAPIPGVRQVRQS